MIRDAANACLCFEKALRQELDSELAYVQALILSYGEALLETGQFKKALSLDNYANSLSGSADYLYLMGMICLKNEQYEQALDQFEKAVALPNALKEGRNSYLCYYEIGRILSMISEWGMARNYFLKCGDYPPALHALRILDEQGL